MTEAQVEWYLTVLQPELKRETVKTTHDEDLYQLASMRILRDCAQYVVNCEKDFIKLFCRYYLVIRKQAKTNEYRSIREYGSTRSLSEYYNEKTGDYMLPTYADDPRQDKMMISFEYIELLPQCYRDIFVGLFIEGLTQTELGERLGMTNQRVSQLVEEGVEIIQAELKQIEAL